MPAVSSPRRARLGLISDKEDFCSLFFAGSKTRKACRLFLAWLKQQGGTCTRREFSQFTRDLEQGKIARGFTYYRNHFYRVIRRRLLDLGFLTLTSFFDYNPESMRVKTVLKYAPVRQPIPTWRGPPGKCFYRLAWEICKKWNEMWEELE